MLGHKFLMTSLFTASEVALGRLGVGACPGETLDVVVGGLGFGYRAESLQHPASAWGRSCEVPVRDVALMQRPMPDRAGGDA